MPNTLDASFTQLAAQGFIGLLPIVPPDARIGRRPDGQKSTIEGKQGKVPGLLHKDGTWTGMAGWTKIVTTPPDAATLKRWDKWRLHKGCGMGLLMGGNHLLAIDADIDDELLSDMVFEVTREVLMQGKHYPVRYGRSPRWTLICRTKPGTPLWKSATVKGLPPEGSSLPDLAIDVLGAGRQTVLAGLHPKTSQPFLWDHLPDDPKELTPAMFCPVTHEQLGAWYTALCELMAADKYAMETESRWLLGKAGDKLVRAGKDGNRAVAPPKTEAAASFEAVKQLVRALPLNLNRDQWLKVCRGLQGACCTSEDMMAAGRTLFAKWSAQWQGDQHGLTPTDLAVEAAEKWDELLASMGWPTVGFDWLVSEACSWSPERAGELRTAAFEGEFEDAPAETPEPSLRELLGLPELKLAAAEVAGMSDRALAVQFLFEQPVPPLYVIEHGRAVSWNGASWAPEKSTRSAGLAVRIANYLAELSRTAKPPPDASNPGQALATLRKRLQSNGTITAVQRLAENYSMISIEQFDDPARTGHLLATPEGVVDLRSGQHTAARPTDLMLRQASVSPTPPGVLPARWLKFIEEVTCGDDDLASWLKRVSGYTLTAETSEHQFFYLYGPGSNGKSVFIEVLQRLLADYGVAAAAGAFSVRPGAAQRETETQLGALAGARMVVGAELSGGARWDTDRIKSFTAGDRIAGRYLYGDQFTFEPIGKLWFTGNSIPSLAAADVAIRRRMRLVGFEYQPEKPDRKLARRLIDSEGPAILRWCIEGAAEWYEHGLPECAAVTRLTEDYMAENDALLAFARDCLVMDWQASVAVSELWQAWETWSARADNQAVVLALEGRLPTKRTIAKMLLGRLTMLKRNDDYKSRKLQGARLRLQAVP